MLLVRLAASQPHTAWINNRQRESMPNESLNKRQHESMPNESINKRQHESMPNESAQGSSYAPSPTCCSPEVEYRLKLLIRLATSPSDPAIDNS